MAFLENLNFIAKIMPIWWSINLECTLIYQDFFYEKCYLPLNWATIKWFYVEVAEKFLNGI